MFEPTTQKTTSPMNSVVLRSDFRMPRISDSLALQRSRLDHWDQGLRRSFLDAKCAGYITSFSDFFGGVWKTKWSLRTLIYIYIYHRYIHVFSLYFPNSKSSGFIKCIPLYGIVLAIDSILLRSVSGFDYWIEYQHLLEKILLIEEILRKLIGSLS